MSFTLPADRLLRAARGLRALALSFAVAYLLVPVLALMLARALFADDLPVRVGLLVLASLPCTLASAVVWTRVAGGNDAVPMVFTAASNGLTFLLCPAILWLTLARWVPVDGTALAARLLTRVLLPIAAGQAARAVAPRIATRLTPAADVFGKALVLAIVLIAISKSAGLLRGAPLAAGGLVLTALGIHLAALGAAGGLARLLRLSRGDAIGVCFAASQKTLYVGVYLLAAFFPDLPGALLPVLAYHVVQLAVDTLLAQRWARDVGEETPPTPSR
jgi:sodium/bile acid cotransporter 7